MAVLRAVLWATILAIVFAPVCQRLAKSMGQRRNLTRRLAGTVAVP
jgi:predicted PurR-regulated permease PerM